MTTTLESFGNNIFKGITERVLSAVERILDPDDSMEIVTLSVDGMSHEVTFVQADGTNTRLEGSSEFVTAMYVPCF